MSKLLFGTDPESFPVYEKDGELYSLPPYYFRRVLGVSASDDKKHPIFLEKNEFRLHEDGAAMEMAILPSSNPRDIFDRIQECANLASKMILSQFPDDCLPVLQFLPTVGFDVERWKNMPEDFFMSTTFGCDPSKDAWNLDKKSRIVDASKHPHRYAGGHIHISGSRMIENEPILAVKSLAVTAGCAAVAFSDVPDLERERTFEYGIPGNYRVQRYGKNNHFGKDYSVGIEYRTISSRWCSNWNLAVEIFKWAEIGINNVLEGRLYLEILDSVGEYAREAILTCNQNLAKQVLSYVESKI